jgi:peptidoglycan/xylan/chitin deacetylase (PgdA/CDA1 family)
MTETRDYTPGSGGWKPGMMEETFGKERPTNLAKNWPDGVRMAVMLTFDTEGDIDVGIPGYVGGSRGRWNDERINYVDLTQRQYDLRSGIRRILRILDKYSIPGTFPTPGLTAEWYPEAIREIASRGHEVAVHGYRHVQHFNLSEEEEREEIEKATEAVEATLGKRPLGWRSPLYSITPSTLGILMDLEYLYNSDLHNDDMPYVLENGGRQIVEIPATLDDWDLYLMNVPGIRMGGVGYGVPANVTKTLSSYFDILYEESASEPRAMQFAMHPKISGRPQRAHALEEFIQHAKGHSGVWFCTMGEMARLCL